MSTTAAQPAAHALPTAGTGFRVYHPALPEVCPRDPDRMALAADADGRCEIFTWDAATGTARQVTDSPYGTLHCALDADARVWWFAEDRRGRGQWFFQDYEGGARQPGLTGLPPGLPHGLAVSDAGTVAIGLGDGSGMTVHLGRPGGPARQVWTVGGQALLTGISPSGGLLALSGAAKLRPRGHARHLLRVGARPALRTPRPALGARLRAVPVRHRAAAGPGAQRRLPAGDLAARQRAVAPGLVPLRNRDHRPLVPHGTPCPRPPGPPRPLHPRHG